MKQTSLEIPQQILDGNNFDLNANNCSLPPSVDLNTQSNAPLCNNGAPGGVAAPSMSNNVSPVDNLNSFKTKWKIPNYIQLLSKDRRVYSPMFVLGDLKQRLLLFSEAYQKDSSCSSEDGDIGDSSSQTPNTPQGPNIQNKKSVVTKTNSNYLSIFLKLVNSREYSVLANFGIQIANSSGSIIARHNGQHTFDSEIDDQGQDKLVSVDDLKRLQAAHFKAQANKSTNGTSATISTELSSDNTDMINTNSFNLSSKTSTNSRSSRRKILDTNDLLVIGVWIHVRSQLQQHFNHSQRRFNGGCIGLCNGAGTSAEAGTIDYGEVTIKFITEQHMHLHHGLELVDRTDKISFVIDLNKHLTLNSLRKRIAVRTGIPIKCQQFWSFTRRQNNTSRPNRKLTQIEMNKQIQTNSIYFVRHCEPSFVRSHQNFENSTFLLLFIKYFDIEKQILRFVGSIFAQNSETMGSVLNRCKQLIGLSAGFEIIRKKAASNNSKKNSTSIDSSFFKTNKQEKVSAVDLHSPNYAVEIYEEENSAKLEIPIFSSRLNCTLSECQIVTGDILIVQEQMPVLGLVCGNKFKKNNQNSSLINSNSNQTNCSFTNLGSLFKRNVKEYIQFTACETIYDNELLQSQKEEFVKKIHVQRKIRAEKRRKKRRAQKLRRKKRRDDCVAAIEALVIDKQQEIQAAEDADDCEEDDEGNASDTSIDSQQHFKLSNSTTDTKALTQCNTNTPFKSLPNNLNSLLNHTPNSLNRLFTSSVSNSFSLSSTSLSNRNYIPEEDYKILKQKIYNKLVDFHIIQSNIRFHFKFKGDHLDFAFSSSSSSSEKSCKSNSNSKLNFNSCQPQTNFNKSRSTLKLKLDLDKINLATDIFTGEHLEQKNELKEANFRKSRPNSISTRKSCKSKLSPDFTYNFFGNGFDSDAHMRNHQLIKLCCTGSMDFNRYDGKSNIENKRRESIEEEKEEKEEKKICEVKENCDLQINEKIEERKKEVKSLSLSDKKKAKNVIVSPVSSESCTSSGSGSEEKQRQSKYEEERNYLAGNSFAPILLSQQQQREERSLRKKNSGVSAVKIVGKKKKVVQQVQQKNQRHVSAKTQQNKVGKRMNLQQSIQNRSKNKKNDKNLKVSPEDLSRQKRTVAIAPTKQTLHGSRTNKNKLGDARFIDKKECLQMNYDSSISATLSNSRNIVSTSSSSISSNVKGLNDTPNYLSNKGRRRFEKIVKTNKTYASTCRSTPKNEILSKTSSVPKTSINRENIVFLTDKSLKNNSKKTVSPSKSGTSDSSTVSNQNIIAGTKTKSKSYANKIQASTETGSSFKTVHNSSFEFNKKDKSVQEAPNKFKNSSQRSHSLSNSPNITSNKKPIIEFIDFNSRQNTQLKQTSMDVKKTNFVLNKDDTKLTTNQSRSPRSFNIAKENLNDFDEIQPGFTCKNLASSLEEKVAGPKNDFEDLNQSIGSFPLQQTDNTVGNKFVEKDLLPSFLLNETGGSNFVNMTKIEPDNDLHGNMSNNNPTVNTCSKSNDINSKINFEATMMSNIPLTLANGNTNMSLEAKFDNDSNQHQRNHIFPLDINGYPHVPTTDIYSTTTSKSNNFIVPGASNPDTILNLVNGFEDEIKFHDDQNQLAFQTNTPENQFKSHNTIKNTQINSSPIKNEFNSYGGQNNVQDYNNSSNFQTAISHPQNKINTNTTCTTNTPQTQPPNNEDIDKFMSELSLQDLMFMPHSNQNTAEYQHQHQNFNNPNPAKISASPSAIDSNHRYSYDERAMSSIVDGILCDDDLLFQPTNSSTQQSLESQRDTYSNSSTSEFVSVTPQSQQSQCSLSLPYFYAQQQIEQEPQRNQGQVKLGQTKNKASWNLVNVENNFNVQR